MPRARWPVVDFERTPRPTSSRCPPADPPLQRTSGQAVRRRPVAALGDVAQGRQPSRQSESGRGRCWLARPVMAASMPRELDAFPHERGGGMARSSAPASRVCDAAWFYPNMGSRARPVPAADVGVRGSSMARSAPPWLRITFARLGRVADRDRYLWRGHRRCAASSIPHAARTGRRGLPGPRPIAANYHAAVHLRAPSSRALADVRSLGDRSAVAGHDAPLGGAGDSRASTGGLDHVDPTRHIRFDAQRAAVYRLRRACCSSRARWRERNLTRLARSC